MQEQRRRRDGDVVAAVQQMVGLSVLPTQGKSKVTCERQLAVVGSVVFRVPADAADASSSAVHRQRKATPTQQELRTAAEDGLQALLGTDVRCEMCLVQRHGRRRDGDVVAEIQQVVGLSLLPAAQWAKVALEPQLGAVGPMSQVQS
jgi:hypothetical protein